MMSLYVFSLASVRAVGDGASSKAAVAGERTNITKSPQKSNYSTFPISLHPVRQRCENILPCNRIDAAETKAP